MKKKEIQDYLYNLWGTVIRDMQVDLLNDTLIFNIEIHKNDHTDFQTLKFNDVSAFYYVKDNLENRFNLMQSDLIFLLTKILLLRNKF
ncbi:MAG: hypothetical protein WBF39_00510, partial [Planococcus donghaensis]